MQLSNKAKIALVLAVLLVIAVILVLIFNKQKETEIDPSETPTSDEIYVPDTTKYASSPTEEDVKESPQSVDEMIGISPRPTSSVSASTSSKTSPARVAKTPKTKVLDNGIKYYDVEITPAPNAGQYDWTNEGSMRVVDISDHEDADKNLCQMAGLTDSWSNTLEKLTCDSLNFYETKIIEPLAAFACAIHASNLQINYDNNIKYEYKGGACLIIDRGE